MINNLNHGARVAMLGLPKDRYAIDWGKVITHMITIKGIYGREMYDTWYAMSAMLATSPVLRGRALGDHPPLPRRAVAGGLCRGPIRPVRQGRPGLELNRLDVTLATASKTPRRLDDSAPYEERHLMYGAFKDQLAATLQEIRAAGLYKSERELTSPVGPHHDRQGRCGELLRQQLPGPGQPPRPSSPPRQKRCRSGVLAWPVSASSAARRPCTPSSRPSSRHFLGTEATILYSSCFDANGGVFETLFGEQDAIISDELNHASLIDGIRLCKAQRLRYKNADMADLEAQLKSAAGARRG